MKKPIPFLLSLFFLSFILYSCSDSTKEGDIQDPDIEKSILNLYLQDSPTDYEAVWIDLQEINVELQEASGDSHWEQVPLTRAGRYNLLAFRNGQDTLLSSVDVTGEKLTGIELLLGENNTVDLKNGTTRDLLIPSGDEKKVSLEVDHFDIPSDTSLELILDFDLLNSIQEPPREDSGEYYISPVVHVFSKDATSSIEGWVLPEEAQPQVLVISANHDTLMTLPDYPYGFFKIRGIPAGEYELQVKPDPSTGYEKASLPTISLSDKDTFVTDTIVLSKE